MREGLRTNNHVNSPSIIDKIPQAKKRDFFFLVYVLENFFYSTDI